MSERWILELVDFDEMLAEDETDIDLELVRETVLSIGTPDSEPISLNAIVPRRSRGSTRSRRINGIEEFEDGFVFQLRAAGISGRGDDGIGVRLTGIDSEIYSAEDDFFVVLDYHEELADVINIDAPIRLISSNPLTDDTIFDRLFASNDYKVIDVTEVANDPDVNPPPQDVPEPSSMLGIVILGVLSVSLVLKRKLSGVFS